MQGMCIDGKLSSYYRCHWDHVVLDGRPSVNGRRMGAAVERYREGM